jgi:chemotaxis protein CheD
MTIHPVTKVPSLRKKYVLVEQVVVPEEPCELATILGSCVAVCLWDRVKKVGGMNHFLLPETVNQADSLRGGIASTRKLIQTMLAKSCQVKNMEAHIFGGAQRFFKEESLLSVGKQNVEAAKLVLFEAAILVLSHDTGGEAGRKIYFNIQTGRVRVIKIHYNDPEPKLE